MKGANFVISVNKIALDYEPRIEFFASFDSPTPPPRQDEIEMSEFESAFLCGLLKKFRPKKILEVGVAAGGTTAIILNCLEKIGQEYSMTSVDISTTVWKDPQNKAGYLATSIKNNLKFGKHEFYLGTTLPFVIDEVGVDIDFLILDTTHSMPGESLDFLVALPYLKENAVVCMHDVSLNHSNVQAIHAHATTVLFSAVTADKMLNLIMNDDFSFSYPNIAAFQINSDTMKNIENVFLDLILRWRYLPSNKDLKGYAEMLARHYSQDLYAIFMQALMMNAKSLMAEAQANAAQR